MRPLVLVIRLRIAAIIMVTLEGIFHFQYVQSGDNYLFSLVDKIVPFLSIWCENLGLFRFIFLSISGVLGLEKLFYISFQVFLLCSLLLVYQREHVVQGPDF